MKKNILIIFLSVSLVISLSINMFSFLKSEDETVEKYESLWKILSVPHIYNGKTMIVEGVLSLDEDGVAIYLSKEHMEHNVRKNAIFVDFKFPKSEEEDLLALNGTYVDIQGTINFDNHGPDDSYSGIMTNIQKCSPNGITWGSGTKRDDGTLVLTN